eukprot:11186511-Lingulodinium_polyedra.AAC.1
MFYRAYVVGRARGVVAGIWNLGGPLPSPRDVAVLVWDFPWELEAASAAGGAVAGVAFELALGFRSGAFGARRAGWRFGAPASW